jgi:type IV secretory pathway protease TraF
MPLKVMGPNDYFVMGDNSGNSFDSRHFGPIDGGAFLGRALLVQ